MKIIKLQQDYFSGGGAYEISGPLSNKGGGTARRPARQVKRVGAGQGERNHRLLGPRRGEGPQGWG